jgi:hypothetical protein
LLYAFIADEEEKRTMAKEELGGLSLGKTS